MDNTILHYNNTLNFSLKQNMENVNDLLYNLQNLKQLQNNISQIQTLKDKLQMQTNMASLALLRSCILDEGYVGITLFRNLIRSYYPLSDEQILKYENWLDEKAEQYYITNLNVLKRKGANFSYNSHEYRLRPWAGKYLAKPAFNIITEIGTYKELYLYILDRERHIHWYCQDMFYNLNRHINLSNDIIVSEINNKDINFLIQNEYIIWNWEIVKKINEQFKNVEWGFLLENEAFIAQMGINTIENTIKELQTITGTEIIEDEIAKILTKYSTMGIKLYSYVPSLSKAFIFEHQNELDWNVLIRNPYIQWDLDLINLFLSICKSDINESEWDIHLDNPSYAMYQAIEPYLNDELLSDIEKLYYI